MLDPIADKLLVGATAADADATTAPSTASQVWAAVIILCREILVSGLREFLAELNVGCRSPGSPNGRRPCRWSRSAFLLAGPAGDRIVPGVTWTGLVLLWVAALLTLWTGFDYLKAAVRTAMEH